MKKIAAAISVYSYSCLASCKGLRRRALTFAAAVLATSGPMFGDALAIGKTTKQHQMVLSCPMPLPESDKLCRALADGIRAISPDSVLYFAQENLGHASGTHVSLVVTSQNHFGIIGHLEWRTASSPKPSKGPEVRFDVMDTTLSAEFFPHFVQGLLEATPEFLAE
ncbi:hypothetical protein BXY66_3575 [Shimia isoporae]|uniref:Uncharacterized protein n=1 Tax=Shimia isoporae TaxID=647720 RepID=A0A4R1N323_9RHOB|nr:hypothetical protein BXY66_3575 [Shimia isoporae]